MRVIHQVTLPQIPTTADRTFASMRVAQINHWCNMFGFNVGNGVRLYISDSEFSDNRQYAVALGHGSTLTGSAFIGNGGCA